MVNGENDMDSCFIALGVLDDRCYYCYDFVSLLYN